MHLSYRDLEEFIARLHAVAPERRTALKGRLKHFQRLSWPAGTNQGKGARVEYGIGQTMSLAVGMEMLQLGLTPERVVEQFRFGAGTLAYGFREALAGYGPNADPVYYFFAPESLASLRGELSEPSGLLSILVSRSEISKLFSQGNSLTEMRRFAFINLTDILDEYVDHFIGAGLGAAENLREPIERWAKVEKGALRKSGWMMSMDDGDGNP